MFICLECEEMMKIPIDAQALLTLGQVSIENGTQDKWMDIALEWLEHYINQDKQNEDMDRWKKQALEYCVEVYQQYTRAEVGNFHGSIIRCWKVGKRACKDNTSV